MDEKMNEALDQIRDEHIAEAAVYNKRKRPYWLGAVAAVLAVAVMAGVLRSSTVAPDAPTELPIVQGTEPPAIGSIGGIVSPQLSDLAAAPVYPEMIPCPNYEDYDDDGYYAALAQWQAGRAQQYDQPSGYADSLTDFFQRSIPEFLSGDENRAYSPLNVYMALAMLAEVTDGSSRQQILDLLGIDTIEALRTQVSYVWNAHYCDDGQTATLLANSLWLDEAYTFNADTARTLAQQYYASVFHGDLGTDELDQQLRAWLDSQTGGLLQDKTSQLELPDDTVFALASTIFFTTGWEAGFSENDTAEGLFHCDGFDLRTQFMNDTLTFGTYYRGEEFGAVRLGLENENDMWLILPDEGVRVEDVLESGAYLELTRDPGGWDDQKVLTIHLSLPKFDISTQTDLIDGMKNLGVTDVFDRHASDFSPIVPNARELFVDKIDHAVRVAIDEEGVIAAAYAVMSMTFVTAPDLPEEEIDFILDRPFLFLITSQDALPLFAGVVEQP